MIRGLASSENVKRAYALKDDIRVAVSVHEGGHIIMGRQHGLCFPLLLPALIEKGNGMDIAEHAGAATPLADLHPRSATDVIFGGYCAELAFYDEHFLQFGAPMFVNADRAANDLIGFLRLFTRNAASASLLQEKLIAGGSAAEDAVKALFQQYGRQTYKTMRSHRADLISVAQELFDFWSAHEFQKCIWRQ